MAMTSLDYLFCLSASSPVCDLGGSLRRNDGCSLAALLEPPEPKAEAAAEAAPASFPSRLRGVQLQAAEQPLAHPLPFNTLEAISALPVSYPRARGSRLVGLSLRRALRGAFGASLSHQGDVMNMKVPRQPGGATASPSIASGRAVPGLAGTGHHAGRLSVEPRGEEAQRAPEKLSQTNVDCPRLPYVACYYDPGSHWAGSRPRLLAAPAEQYPSPRPLLG